MRVSQAVQNYLLARRAELAPHSRRQYRNILTVAVNTIGPDMAIRALKRRHVEKWLAGLDQEPSTIRQRLSVFRGFVRWCLIHGHLKHDPTLGLKAPRIGAAMPRELSGDEVRRLLEVVPDARGELIVMLALVEGMRVGSVAAQLRSDIDLDGEMMLVTKKKGGGQQWLPLMPDTLEAIRTYYREVPGTTGPLLRSMKQPANGLTANYLSTLVSCWMHEAGIKHHPRDGRSAHALRHTMAGAMLDEGADIRDVQDALGHATLGPTMIYLRRRSAGTRLREVMGRRSYREAEAS